MTPKQLELMARMFYSSKGNSELELYAGQVDLHFLISNELIRHTPHQYILTAKGSAHVRNMLELELPNL